MAAAMLTVTPALANSFEYNLVEGVPCTQQPDESFTCSDGSENSTVALDDYYAEISVYPTTPNLGGVKAECGGPDAFIFFVMNAAGFYVEECSGKALSSVITVRARNDFSIQSAGQELTFTDADPCTQSSDGGFTCSGGGTIRTANGAITMTAEEDVDTAIRVICNAGSSVFYTSAGDIGNFMKPSVCGDDHRGPTGFNWPILFQKNIVPDINKQKVVKGEMSRLGEKTSPPFGVSHELYLGAAVAVRIKSGSWLELYRAGFRATVSPSTGEY
ncbi:uncharacterized protein LY79DRAFT_577367 [Colletotrichum navitas]|uniref:Uncharacterized protein n=1 Tax=Colletotrichum navitas TaxID=681940 RepID=A0AAD8V8I7_9PEZI|nr:uncharacterized protein LY79DRAFT_577367 [Colletotrichum navitas]KAK1596328.1 hypothetical protein LY79DRAFT_577367 [Colletotrichum navitas]